MLINQTPMLNAIFASMSLVQLTIKLNVQIESVLHYWIAKLYIESIHALKVTFVELN